MKGQITIRVLWVVCLLPVLAVYSPAHADLITKNATINDITALTRSQPTGPNIPINLGDMTISLADAGTYSQMNATFTVDPAASAMTGLWRDLSLHWLQTIWHDDDPAQRGGANPNFPVVDPPSGGWDYMYLDGAARTQPNLGIPNFGWFIDSQPWYYNSTGDAARSTIGQSYAIRDVPADPTTGYTGFTTFLVATDPKVCNAPGCMTPTDILVLAGFDWTVSALNIMITNPFASPRLSDVADITNSLLNGAFAGWNVTDTKAALVDEPSTALLVLTGTGLMLFIYRRRGWTTAQMPN